MASIVGMTSLSISTQPFNFSSLRVLKTSSHQIHLPQRRIPPTTITTVGSPPFAPIRMGGGPRTYPGGVSKWQWKRMQAKKAKQLLKARLCRERQIYEMRKRAELQAAVSELERPWEVVERAPRLFSVKADEQLKVLADRFQRPGGYDLWTDNDGPELFRSPADGLPSARFFPKGVVHSIKPYGRIAGNSERESEISSADSIRNGRRAGWRSRRSLNRRGGGRPNGDGDGENAHSVSRVYARFAESKGKENVEEAQSSNYVSREDNAMNGEGFYGGIDQRAVGRNREGKNYRGRRRTGSSIDHSRNHGKKWGLEVDDDDFEHGSINKEESRWIHLMGNGGHGDSRNQFNVNRREFLDRGENERIPFMNSHPSNARKPDDKEHNRRRISVMGNGRHSARSHRLNTRLLAGDLHGSNLKLLSNNEERVGRIPSMGSSSKNDDSSHQFSPGELWWQHQDS